MTLTKEGKEDIALALILLKDFKQTKCQDMTLYYEHTANIIKLAQYLDVYKEYDCLISKTRTFEIKEM